MDGQLILRRPYTYTAQTEGLSKVIQEHMNEPAFTAFQHWWEWDMKHKAGNTIELLILTAVRKIFIGLHLGVILVVALILMHWLVMLIRMMM